jgi:hypothetical protein
MVSTVRQFHFRASVHLLPDLETAAVLEELNPLLQPCVADLVGRSEIAVWCQLRDKPVVRVNPETLIDNVTVGMLQRLLTGPGDRTSRPGRGEVERVS